MKNIIKKLKRGFTIVELVIVIAVIAILAAVLIPTLANVINMAEESNDIQTVKNLNTIVSAYDSLGEITTVNDALDGALENGYSVSALTPTSDGNVIVYDASSNRFALLSENALTENATEDDIIYTDGSTSKTDWTTSTTWVFVEMDDAKLDNGEYDLSDYKNSVILVGKEWNAANVKASYGVSLYDYTESAKLAKLTIDNDDAEKQTVKTSGNSNGKSAVAKTTAADSTEVDTIVINVEAVYLSVTASVYNISKYSASAYVEISGCTLNEYSTTEVYNAANIGSGNTINNYYSGITADDIYLVLGSSATVSSVYVDKTSSVTVSAIQSITMDKDGTIGGNYAEITVKDGQITIELGTEKYPFLISDLDDFEVLRKRIEDGTTEGVYFSLENDLELNENWQPLGSVYFEYVGAASVTVQCDVSDIFNGIFEGNDKTIKMNDSNALEKGSDYALFAYVGTGAEIRNLKFNMSMSSYNYYSCGAVASYVYGDGADSITIENITVDGTITAEACAGGVAGWAARGCTFKNCVNNASITTSRTSGYSAIGGIAAQAGAYKYTDGNNGDTTFINCVNNGVLKHAPSTTGATSYSLIGHIVGQVSTTNNSADAGYVNECTITFTNCSYGDNATITGYGQGSGRYLFEGYDTKDSTNTYSGTANANKLLIGGYLSYYVIIDGTTYTFNTSNYSYFACGSD